MRRIFPSVSLWRKNYGKGNSVVGAIAPGGVHTNCFPPETLECNLKRNLKKSLLPLTKGTTAAYRAHLVQKSVKGQSPIPRGTALHAHG